MGSTVLIIEDESSIADAIEYALRSEGFHTMLARTGGDGLVQARTGAPSCVILDIGLPDRSGFDVCRELRSFTDIPVIFLSARDGEIDRIVGLELGADDYVVKPFSPRELAARVRAVLRRRPETRVVKPVAAPCASDVSLCHDPERRRILCFGQVLPLTRNEYLLLATLLSAPGRVFSRDQLMEAAWEDPGSALDRTVDAHVKSVRAKIRAVAPDLQPIETHRGLGYSLFESVAS